MKKLFPFLFLAITAQAIIGPFPGGKGGGGGGSGTVTSVGLADGSSTPIFTITGSPVTTSGTLTETLKNEAAHACLIGPSSGSAAQPTFRTLVAADLPTGDLTSSPTTNLTVTNGSGAVIGSGTTLVLTGASLVEATSSVLTLTGATNAVLGTGTSIQVKQASTSQSGYLSSTDWNTFNGKGAGTVTGPVSSVSGDFATWNGTGGTAINDNGLGYHYTPSTTFSLDMGASNAVTAAANLTVFGTQNTSGSANTNSAVFGNLIFAGTGSQETLVGQNIGTSSHTFNGGTDTLMGYSIGKNLTSDAGGLNAIFGSSPYGAALGARNSLVGANISFGRSLGTQNSGIGYQIFGASTATTSNATAVGYNALGAGVSNDSCALGSQAGSTNGGTFDIFLGFNSDTTDGSSNKFIVGSGISSSTGQIYDTYIGSGMFQASGFHSMTYHQTGASGANVAATAATMIFAGAQSTGTGGAGADIIFQVAPASGSSSSTPNTEVEALRIDATVALPRLPVRAAASTPTCGSTQQGDIALTSTGIMCACISSAWVLTSTGLPCTF